MAKTLRVALLSATLLFRLPALYAVDRESPMKVLASPPVAPANAHYPGNRPPLLPSPLVKLPPGAVRATGWLGEQLRLEAAGFVGHLTEISPWCRFENSAWADPQGRGERGWEELPYWLKGFASLGFAARDERIIGEARRWIEACLASRRADGWFGPQSNQDANDCWPNMIMLYALRTWHEATGDPRVIELMTGYFRYLHQLPPGQLLRQTAPQGWWQSIRGGDQLDSIYWLYNRTGEPWLLSLAEANHRATAAWVDGIPSWHGVNLCQGFREPAQWYQQSRDPQHLADVHRNYAQIWDVYGQVPGGMFGADENARPGYVGPRQAAETCSMVELMHSAEMLLRITGDPVWADRCEEVALNSLPAAMPPDLKGLHYLTAPNMVQLCRTSKAPMLQNGGDMLSYNPFDYRCCQHNVAFGWPYYAEHLWAATAGNGLAACLYAPCEVTAQVGDGRQVTITEATDYPFGETITLLLDTAEPVTFPLMLRVPDWCEGAGLAVNGRQADAAAPAGSWLLLDRSWQSGDTVVLRLPMAIRSHRWTANGDTVSVSRGPLTFSLRIEERWQRYNDREDWPAYEVFPASPWNYGLELDPMDASGSFELVTSSKPIADQPFTLSDAPVVIRAKARRIPEWRQEGNGLVAEVQPSPARTDEPLETVTLVPMACARLRIAAFPTVSTAATAHRWTPPPPPPFASHCWSNDTVTALSDGLEPRSSNDHSIPRFTWWDHRGSAEWVGYRFDEPRRISGCEVYWFDDTGVGQCRVPASWRVTYLDGEEWRPVANPTGYGVAKDTYNRVDFDPVETTAIRIEVQLQPGFSGGILEWKLR